jgi:MFS family permease
MGAGSGRRRRRFEALEVWNFRAYFVGQLVSSVGTWMQTLGLAWLVLELTDRTDQLGVVVALQFLPLLLLGALGGVVVDRVDNRRLLIASSATSGVLALTLGLLVAADRASMLVIGAVALGFGLVGAVERPAMQAILFQLVGPDRLTSAIAINGTINTSARLIGPAVAGLAIATVGISACFFVNAASYLVVIAALRLLRPDQLLPRPPVDRGAGRLREGLRYVADHPEVRRPLVVMAVMGTLVYNFQISLPAMVRFGFDRGAGSTGALLSVSAVGSIIGGLGVAGVSGRPRHLLAGAVAAMGATLALFAVAPTYWVFVAVSVPMAMTSSGFLTIDTSLLQRATEPSVQGRVMALHQIAWQGSTPVGAVITGWLIEATSPRAPFAVGSLAAFGCAVAVLWPRQRMHRGDGPEAAPAVVRAARPSDPLVASVDEWVAPQDPLS